MISWFFLFVALMLVVSLSLQKPQEAMTCSRPIYGPEGIRPGLYGPGDGPFNPGNIAPQSTHPGCRVRNDLPVIDDGKCSSDTSSKNANCLPTYSYSPSLDRAFPTNGLPPMPFLNDFSALGR